MSDKKVKECQYCKSEISRDASICPNCRKDQRDFAKKHPFITFFLSILIIGYFWHSIFSWVSSNPTSSNSSSNSIPNSWSCPSDIKKLITSYYKSPSTVEFISCKYTREGSSYTFFWEADSQNWFWAIVRSSFVCKWDSCNIVQR